jgi:hypothetical protein
MQAAAEQSGRTTAEDALVAARVALLGARASIPAHELLAMAWTPETYRRLETLAAHARQVESAAARWSDGSGVSVAAALTALGEQVAWRNGVLAEEVGPWLGVLAAEPDTDRHARLRAAIRTWDDRDDGPPPATPTRCLAEWGERLGWLAPLAWASGLDLEDVETSVQSSVDPAPMLSGLAVLRGYRLTDPWPLTGRAS